MYAAAQETCRKRRRRADPSLQRYRNLRQELSPASRQAPPQIQLADPLPSLLPRPLTLRLGNLTNPRASKFGCPAPPLSNAVNIGAVVTNHGYSDWSTQDFMTGVSEVWLRIRREADDYLVHASTDGLR